MDKKAQGSGSGKARGIGELLAIARVALTLRWNNHGYHMPGARLEER